MSANGHRAFHTTVELFHPQKGEYYPVSFGGLLQPSVFTPSTIWGTFLHDMTYAGFARCFCKRVTNRCCRCSDGNPIAPLPSSSPNPLTESIRSYIASIAATRPRYLREDGGEFKFERLDGSATNRPYPRAWHVAERGASESELVVFGGRIDGFNHLGVVHTETFGDVWHFVAPQTWTQICTAAVPCGAAAPGPRWASVSARFVADDNTAHMVVHGGQNASGNAIDETWVLQVSPPYVWTQMASTPQGLAGHVAVVVGGKLFLMSGYDTAGASLVYNSDVFVYEYVAVERVMVDLVWEWSV